MALLDIIGRRRGEYEITQKVKGNSAGRELLLPHRLAAAAVAGAWAFGLTRQQISTPILHAASIATIMISLALILSELAPAPDPYDPGLYSES
jgi:hypothetical protein